MAHRDLVVVGASAGGVEALCRLVADLPVDLPAAVLVVLHVPPAGRSALPAILSRAGALPARHAQRDDLLEPGVVLVAPPDRHLLVYDHAVALSRGPTENGHRPAVDVLFRTAAAARGNRVVAVVLSGALDDGAAGCVAVQLRGGVCLAQDPDDALHPGMPSSAVQAGGVHKVLPLSDLASGVVDLLQEPISDENPPPPPRMHMEAAMADMDPEALETPDRPGTPAGFSCPDCSGSLFQIVEGGLVRFRCRVGHAWSPHSLLAQQSVAHESALWMAMRSLEEKAALSDKLSARARDRGHSLTAASFERQAGEARHAARLVRELIDETAGSASVDLPAVEEG